VNLKQVKLPEILWALSGCWPRSTDRTLKEVVTMQVTEVDIVLVKPKDVHSKLVGSDYRLTYPTRKIGDTQFSLFHPIRKPFGLAIERAIVEKLKNVMSKRDVGHGRIDAGQPAL
jgi:stage V sporulation protein G